MKNENELKKMQRASLLKMIVIAVIVVLFVVFSSVAWFTQSREVEGSGVQMTATKQPFLVESIVEDENHIAGRKGTFYQGVHSLLNVPENQIWLMLQDENLENFENNAEGIEPGSEGKVSFNLTPLEEPLSVDYEFQITGYQAVAGEVPEPIMVNDQTNADLANLLNGHLLLFRDRIETEGGDYIYKGFIGSDADMNRVLRNVPYSGVDVPQTVTFYWIWPKTLSCLGEFNPSENIAVICDKIILYDDDGNVTNDTVTGKTTYQRVIEHIEQNPQYYMKDVTGTVQASDIASDYLNYGDKYDQADNRIGAAVDYVILKMTVTTS